MSISFIPQTEEENQILTILANYWDDGQNDKLDAMNMIINLREALDKAEDAVLKF